jgi:hypothetical protein
MVRTEYKRITPLRLVVLVVGLTLLLFACIGVLVALRSETSAPSAPEALKPGPQVRQIDRESFRQESRNNGS